MDNETEYISAREFTRAIAALTNAMADGFHGVNSRVEEGLIGVHKRLDVTNGRLGKHDTEIMHLLERATKHSSALAQIDKQQAKESERSERADERAEHQRHTDAANVIHLHSRANDKPIGDNEPITMKDLKRAVYVTIGTLSAIGAAFKWLPLLLKAAQP